MNPSSRLNRSTFPTDESSWRQSYLRHLPLLGLSIIFSFFAVYLMLQYSPAQLNWRWLPDVYLPLQITMYLALFFLLSFITLNSRRGYLLATFFQTLIFLRLQRVALNREVVLSLIGLFVIIECITSLLIFFKSHANVSQKSRSHHRSRYS